MRAIPIEAIREAAIAIRPLARRTPLIRLDLTGVVTARPFDLYLKLETLQPVGSFKIRGAYNALRRLTPPQLDRGVWTVSAGNAAQGVALAARELGVSCSVLVMETAPATKLAAIERFGARIVRASYDECWEAVERHGSAKMQGSFVHPFDDDDFIAGNATIGLEILEDLPEVDTVVMSVGGGGLLAGVGSALRALRPATTIQAAEPATAAPLAHSLGAGRATVFPDWRASFVDGAGGRSVLPTMWPLLSDLVSDSMVVSLDQIAHAMRLVAERAHVISEGAGACAVAAALAARRPAEKVVAVVSGGNIDLSQFTALVDKRSPGRP